MSKGKGNSSSSSFSKIEWVTLISNDNYQFVIDKRFALRSIFIRSMLGESETSNATRKRGGGGNRKSVASKVVASDLLRTEGIPNDQEQQQDNNTEMNEETNGTFDSMGGRATPPPAPKGMELLSNSNGGEGGDPEGYVNPFAAGNDVTNDEDDDSDDDHNLFQSGFAEAQSNTVHFPNIRGIILEKVVEYLCWNARYFDAKDIDIPDFQLRIRPEIAVELLMAADFLHED